MCLGLLLATASPAGAELVAGGSQIRTTYPLSGTAPYLDGPVFSGARVIWGVSQGDEGHEVLIGSPHAAPKVLFRIRPLIFRAPTETRELTIALSASANRVAYWQRESTQTKGDRPIITAGVKVDARTGPIGGRLTSPCQGCPPCALGAPPQLLSDSVTAFVDLCDQQVVFDDAASGVRKLFALATKYSYPALAGTYIAHRPVADAFGYPTPTIAIANWRTGEELYRVDTSGLPGGRERLIALQPDGKLVVATQSDTPTVSGHLAWYSPDDPSPHVLAEAAWYWDAVAVASDHIAVRFSDAPYRARDRIDVLDLDGRRQAIVEGEHGLGDQRSFDGSMDFDGQRIIWGLKRCDRLEVYSADIAALPIPYRYPSGACPGIRVGSSAVSRARSVRVSIACPDVSYSCAGTVSGRLVIANRRHLRLAGSFGIRRVAYSIEPRTIRAVTLPLSRHARTSLRAKGARVRLVVAATSRLIGARPLHRTIVVHRVIP